MSQIKIQTMPWAGKLPSIQDAAIPRLNAHRAAWITTVANGLSHPTFLIQATVGSKTVGVLPLCVVKGPIFGRFLVSLPYVNTGGVWASDPQVAQGLIAAACDLADQLQVKYLELRHEKPIEHHQLTFERTDKLHMRLTLPDSADQLLLSLKSLSQN